MLATPIRRRGSDGCTRSSGEIERLDKLHWVKPSGDVPEPSALLLLSEPCRFVGHEEAQFTARTFVLKLLYVLVPAMLLAVVALQAAAVPAASRKRNSQHRINSLPGEVGHRYDGGPLWL